MKKILISLAAVLFCVSLTAQNSIILKMNLEKNKVYRLKSITEQTVSQTVNGVQQNVVSDVNYTLSLRMIDATPVFMVAEVHFDTLITNTNSMGRNVSINSTREGDIKSSETGEIMSYLMNRLSRSAIFAKIDYTGRPLEIVNQKMLSDMVLKDTGSLTLTGPMKTAVKAQLVASVSEDNLKTMIGSFTWFLPNKEVKTGDTWSTYQQTKSGGMLLDINTSFHLDRLNGNNAEVNMESKIAAPANATPLQSGGATVTYDNIQGMSRSDMIIDSRTGLVVEIKAKTHITGNLGVSAPGVSMQIPMDINGESKIKAL